MKLPCSIVRELLPLYMDGCLEAENQALVEEHLCQCPDCAKLLETERQGFDPSAAAQPDKTEAEAVRRSVRKVKKRLGFLSVKGVAAILACLLLIWLGVNQARGIGICFTNLDELVTAQLFMGDLKAGDYESAFNRMDAEGYYESLLAYWKENLGGEERAEEWVQALEKLGKENYVNEGRKLFCQQLKETKFADKLDAYRYSFAYYIEDDGWHLGYFAIMGGEGEQVDFHFPQGSFTASGGYDLTLDSGLITSVLSGWQYQLWEEYCG